MRVAGPRQCLQEFPVRPNTDASMLGVLAVRLKRLVRHSCTDRHSDSDTSAHTYTVKKEAAVREFLYWLPICALVVTLWAVCIIGYITRGR